MESWLGVELRHLAALSAVAEERSFRGAAERLGYVQSAMSQRIAQLERLVGARLVERSRGLAHVEVTEAGRALLRHADQIHIHMQAAQADLRALTEGRGGSESLRVGVYGGMATRLLPQSLALLAEQSPDLRVHTRETQSDGELFAYVESGELDAAFAELPLQPGPFVWKELLVDSLVLVVPAGSPLAHRSAPPDLAEIAQHPLVVDPTWRMFALVESEFDAAGQQLDKRFSATSNTGVQALVSAGVGLAIMPRLAVDLDDPTTEAVEFDGLTRSRKLVCYWHSNRQSGGALEAFLEAMRAACAPLRDADGRQKKPARFQRPVRVA